jgi:hypothetical protein
MFNITAYGFVLMGLGIAGYSLLLQFAERKSGKYAMLFISGLLLGALGTIILELSMILDKLPVR